MHSDIEKHSERGLPEIYRRGEWPAAKDLGASRDPKAGKLKLSGTVLRLNTIIRRTRPWYRKIIDFITWRK